jgi:gliding motility-associated-like protein
MNYGLLSIFILFSGYSALCQSIFSNPSFEGTPAIGQSPPFWSTDLTGCGGYSTPDIQPGFWGNYLVPHQGNSYLGMVARNNGTSEGIFQRLPSSLFQGDCYSFTIHLAKAIDYEAHGNPAVLEIWSGDDRCQVRELLWSSPSIQHTAWLPYKVNFTPSVTREYIIFLVKGYASNILIDDIIDEEIIHNTLELAQQNYVCEGSTLSLDATFPGADSYAWSTGETNPVIEVSAPGNYAVEVLYKSCLLERSIEIIQVKRPVVSLPQDTSLYYGTHQLQLHAVIEPPDASVLWSTGESAPSITVDESATYWVQVENNCGLDQDAIEVSFLSLYLPNVVTANNDGKNDTFVVSGAEPGSFKLKIVNRWGVLIYEDESYRNTWPSTWVPQGVYYYELINRESGEAFKDFIHLVTD